MVQSRAYKPWLLDEYVVIGDLWLRRGRTVGAGDREVLTLAALLGRTPSSISWRVANFAGTDRPGTGGKPLTGEALKLWTTIRDDPERLAQSLAKAYARLNLLTKGEVDGNRSSERIRIVAPETPGIEPVVVATVEDAREAKQAEAILRREFRKWRDPKGDRLRGIDIRTPTSRLRVDLYDQFNSVLIEVKAAAKRDHLRLAVGQLYDYRRYLPFDVDLAVLVPSRPTEDLLGLLSAAGIGAIWPEGGSFRDSTAGYLLRTPR